ncbi:MAG: hypothetical protein IPJ31_13780 [Bacteroidetes bacterium]|nr:hypothetical protein [Bacteroidota bacterium]
MNELVDRALYYIENEQIPQAKSSMVTLYDYIQENPHELNHIDNPENFASVIATMLQLKVPNDDDAIEQIAGIGYAIISKSIYSKPAPNKNMFRLLMIHFAREHFNFIFRPAFDLLKGGSVWSTRAQMIGTEISNAIYKMEIADLYMNPIIYQKIQMFADAKSELDALIAKNHFYNQTLESIIDEGISLHKKAFDFLNEKYLTPNENVKTEINLVGSQYKTQSFTLQHMGMIFIGYFKKLFPLSKKGEMLIRTYASGNSELFLKRNITKFF